MQIILYQTKSAVKSAPKTRWREIPAKFLKRKLFQNISEENLYQKNAEKYLPKNPWRKTSTNKSLKRNLDQKLRSLHQKNQWRGVSTQKPKNFAKKSQERSLPKKHFLQWKIAKKNKSDEMFWNAMKTHFFMKIQIFSGSNLGRKLVTKTRTTKNSFKTVKKCLPTQSLQKICTKKANSKQLSFLYQTFPHEIPTNKSPTKASYPQKNLFKKYRRNIYKQLFHKNFRPKISKIFLTTRIWQERFFEKNKGALCKRELSQTNNYIQENHALFLQKTTPKVYKQPPTEDIYPKSVHRKIFSEQNRKEQKPKDSTRRWS